MKPTLLLFALTLALSSAACGEEHGDHCTSTTEAVCSGTMIRYCDGEHYGPAEDCPAGQECMTMPDTGVTHCMLSSMMTDDAHGGMDMGDTAHSGMDMGDSSHAMDSGPDAMPSDMADMADM